MPENTFSISTPDVEVEEEVRGEQLFTWRNIIFGLLAGGTDYVESVNQAISEAYNER